MLHSPFSAGYRAVGETCPQAKEVSAELLPILMEIFNIFIDTHFHFKIKSALFVDQLSVVYMGLNKRSIL